MSPAMQAAIDDMRRYGALRWIGGAWVASCTSPSEKHVHHNATIYALWRRGLCTNPLGVCVVRAARTQEEVEEP